MTAEPLPAPPEKVGWVDPASVHDQWPDAVTMDDQMLAELLLVAWEQCAAYAPTLADDAEPPASYRMAQVLQARALWQMHRQGPGDQFSPEGYSIAIYPLDARIRQLLRPKRLFGGLR